LPATQATPRSGTVNFLSQAVTDNLNSATDKDPDILPWKVTNNIPPIHR